MSCDFWGEKVKKFDFQIQAGDDMKVKVSIVDKQSQPVDVSAYRAAMQILSSEINRGIEGRRGFFLPPIFL